MSHGAWKFSNNIYIYKEKRAFSWDYTHDKSESPTSRPITPNEPAKKKKMKATTFLIFQDYKEITIISYKVIIVISNKITHKHSSIPLIK